jgi:hypothetical protein
MINRSASGSSHKQPEANESWLAPTTTCGEHPRSGASGGSAARRRVLEIDRHLSGSFSALNRGARGLERRTLLRLYAENTGLTARSLGRLLSLITPNSRNRCRMGALFRESVRINGTSGKGDAAKRHLSQEAMPPKRTLRRPRCRFLGVSRGIAGAGSARLILAKLLQEPGRPFLCSSSSRRM